MSTGNTNNRAKVIIPGYIESNDGGYVVDASKVQYTSNLTVKAALETLLSPPQLTLVSSYPNIGLKCDENLITVRVKTGSGGNIRINIGYIGSQINALSLLSGYTITNSETLMLALYAKKCIYGTAADESAYMTYIRNLSDQNIVYSLMFSVAGLIQLRIPNIGDYDVGLYRISVVDSGGIPNSESEDIYLFLQKGQILTTFEINSNDIRGNQYSISESSRIDYTIKVNVGGMIDSFRTNGAKKNYTVSANIKLVDGNIVTISDAPTADPGKAYSSVDVDTEIDGTSFIFSGYLSINKLNSALSSIPENDLAGTFTISVGDIEISGLTEESSAIVAQASPIDTEYFFMESDNVVALISYNRDGDEYPGQGILEITPYVFDQNSQNTAGIRCDYTINITEYTDDLNLTHNVSAKYSEKLNISLTHGVLSKIFLGYISTDMYSTVTAKSLRYSISIKIYESSNHNNSTLYILDGSVNARSNDENRYFYADGLDKYYGLHFKPNSYSLNYDKWISTGVSYFTTDKNIVQNENIYLNIQNTDGYSDHMFLESSIPYINFSKNVYILLTLNKFSLYSVDGNNIDAQFTIGIICLICDVGDDTRSYITLSYGKFEIEICHSEIRLNINKNNALKTDFFNKFNKMTHVIIMLKEIMEEDDTKRSLRIYLDGILSAEALIDVSALDISNTDNKLNLLIGKNIETDGLNNTVERIGDVKLLEIYIYQGKCLENDDIITHMDENDVDDHSMYEVHFIKNVSINLNSEGKTYTGFNDLHKITRKKTQGTEIGSKDAAVNCSVVIVKKLNDTILDMYVHRNVDVYLLGTSSLVYPVKNYLIKFYEKDGEEKSKKHKVIPPISDNVELTNDYIYTLKCDYMESSHRNNTPTAEYYQDRVLSEVIKQFNKTDSAKTYSPSIRSNENNRDAICGYPCMVYYNDNESNVSIEYTPDSNKETEGFDIIDALMNVYSLITSLMDKSLEAGSYMFNIDKEGSLLGFKIGVSEAIDAEILLESENNTGNKIEYVYDDSISVKGYYMSDNNGDATDSSYKTVSNWFTVIETTNPNDEKRILVPDLAEKKDFSISALCEQSISIIMAGYVLGFSSIEIVYSDKTISENLLPYFNYTYNRSTKTYTISHISDTTYFSKIYAKDNQAKLRVYAYLYANIILEDGSTNIPCSIEHLPHISYEGSANVNVGAGVFYAMNDSSLFDLYLSYLEEYINNIYEISEELGIDSLDLVSFSNIYDKVKSNSGNIRSYLYLDSNDDKYKFLYTDDDTLPANIDDSYIVIIKYNTGTSKIMYYTANDQYITDDTDNTSTLDEKYTNISNFLKSIEALCSLDIFTLNAATKRISLDTSKFTTKDDLENKLRSTCLYSNDYDKTPWIKINPTGGTTNYTIPPIQTFNYFFNEQNKDIIKYQYVESTLEPRSSYTEDYEDFGKNIFYELTYKNMYDIIDNVNKHANNIFSKSNPEENAKLEIGEFRKYFSKKFNVPYAITYFLLMMVFALIDNAGKNAMFDTWGGLIYIRPYDMDTLMGLNNVGQKTIPPSAELHWLMSPNVHDISENAPVNKTYGQYNYARIHSENDSRYKRYNSYNSNLWRSFYFAFKEEIIAAYKHLRDIKVYDHNMIMTYSNSKTSDIFSANIYNADADRKYLTKGNVFRYCAYGDRKHHFARFLHERLIFMDSLYGYIGDGSLYGTTSWRAFTTIECAPIVLKSRYAGYISITIGTSEHLITACLSPDHKSINSEGDSIDGDLFYLYFAALEKEIIINGCGIINEINGLENLGLGALSIALSEFENLTSFDLRYISYTDTVAFNGLTCGENKFLTDFTFTLLPGTELSTGTDPQLDLSSCVNLSRINISNNKVISLIYLPSNSALKLINIEGTNITQLHIENLRYLNALYCNVSYDENEYRDGVYIKNSKISDLRVHNCSRILTLDINRFGRGNLSNKISITDNSRLESISCEDVYNIDIKAFNIQNCPYLLKISLKGSTFTNKTERSEVIDWIVLNDLNKLYYLNLEDVQFANDSSFNGIGIVLPKPKYNLKRVDGEWNISDYDSSCEKTIKNIFGNTEITKLDIDGNGILEIESTIDDINVENIMCYLNVLRSDVSAISVYNKPTIDAHVYDFGYDGLRLNILNLICCEADYVDGVNDNVRSNSPYMTSVKNLILDNMRAYQFYQCVKLEEVNIVATSLHLSRNNFNSVFAHNISLQRFDIFNKDLLNENRAIYTDTYVRNNITSDAKTLSDFFYLTGTIYKISNDAAIKKFLNFFINITNINQIFRGSYLVNNIDGYFTTNNSRSLKSAISAFMDSKIKTIPIGAFDHAVNLKNILSMFYNCTDLEDVPFTIFNNINVTLDTSVLENERVLCCGALFYNCSKMLFIEGTEPSDTATFFKSNVRINNETLNSSASVLNGAYLNGYMFKGCSKIGLTKNMINAILRSMRTSKSINGLFAGCSISENLNNSESGIFDGLLDSNKKLITKYADGVFASTFFLDDVDDSEKNIPTRLFSEEAIYDNNADRLSLRGTFSKSKFNGHVGKEFFTNCPKISNLGPLSIGDALSYVGWHSVRLSFAGLFTDVPLETISYDIFDIDNIFNDVEDISFMFMKTNSPTNMGYTTSSEITTTSEIYPEDVYADKYARCVSTIRLSDYALYHDNALKNNDSAVIKIKYGEYTTTLLEAGFLKRFTNLKKLDFALMGLHVSNVIPKLSSIGDIYIGPDMINTRAYVITEIDGSGNIILAKTILFNFDATNVSLLSQGIESAKGLFYGNTHLQYENEKVNIFDQDNEEWYELELSDVYDNIMPSEGAALKNAEAMFKYTRISKDMTDYTFKDYTQLENTSYMFFNTLVEGEISNNLFDSSRNSLTNTEGMFFGTNIDRIRAGKIDIKDSIGSDDFISKYSSRAVLDPFSQMIADSGHKSVLKNYIKTLSNDHVNSYDISALKTKIIEDMEINLIGYSIDIELIFNMSYNQTAKINSIGIGYVKIYDGENSVSINISLDLKRNILTTLFDSGIEPNLRAMYMRIDSLCNKVSESVDNDKIDTINQYINNYFSIDTVIGSMSAEWKGENIEIDIGNYIQRAIILFLLEFIKNPTNSSLVIRNIRAPMRSKLVYTDIYETIADDIEKRTPQFELVESNAYSAHIDEAILMHDDVLIFLDINSDNVTLKLPIVPIELIDVEITGDSYIIAYNGSKINNISLMYNKNNMTNRNIEIIKYYIRLLNICDTVLCFDDANEIKEYYLKKTLLYTEIGDLIEYTKIIPESIFIGSASGKTIWLPSGYYKSMYGDALKYSVEELGLFSKCKNLKSVAYMFGKCYSLAGSIPADMFYSEDWPDYKLSQLLDIEGLFAMSTKLAAYDGNCSRSSIKPILESVLINGTNYYYSKSYDILKHIDTYIKTDNGDGTDSIIRIKESYKSQELVDNTKSDSTIGLYGGNYSNVRVKTSYMTDKESDTSVMVIDSNAGQNALIPGDWLKSAVNISNINNLFIGVGSIIPGNSVDEQILLKGDSSLSIAITKKSIKIANVISEYNTILPLEIPNNLFEYHEKISNADCAFALMPTMYLTQLTNAFFSNAGSNLRSVYRIFYKSNISGLASIPNNISDNNSIFYSNKYLSNISQAFKYCKYNYWPIDDKNVAANIIILKTSKLTGTSESIDDIPASAIEYSLDKLSETNIITIKNLDICQDIMCTSNDAGRKLRYHFIRGYVKPIKLLKENYYPNLSSYTDAFSYCLIDDYYTITPKFNSEYGLLLESVTADTGSSNTYVNSVNGVDKYKNKNIVSISSNGYEYEYNTGNTSLLDDSDILMISDIYDKVVTRSKSKISF